MKLNYMTWFSGFLFGISAWVSVAFQEWISIPLALIVTGFSLIFLGLSGDGGQ